MDCETFVDKAIADNPALVEKIKGGKLGVVDALVGKVVKMSKLIDATAARELIIKKLK